LHPRSHHKPEDVEAECRDSLRQLGVDYIDLYLIHWPASFVFGHGFFPKDGNGKFMLLDVPLTATWKAMELLVDKKLVRAIGVSNFNEEEIKSILAVARIEPVVNQIEVHPHCPMHELAKFCADNGIVIMAYSPLGNVNPNEPNQVTPLRDPVIEAIAKAHRKSPAQVLIRYSLQRGFVCIPKSVTPDRIRENAAIFDFELTEQDMAAIHAIKTRKRHINPTFRPGGATIFPPDRF
jgi:diketogulonate reductase-like aldo/keto reductase